MSDKPNTPINPGMPIFLSNVERKLADPVMANVAIWHPGNTAGQKLWACTEPLRDIKHLLQDLPEEQRSRRLKILATPVAALRLAVIQLGDYMGGSPELSPRLTSEIRRRIVKLCNKFKSGDSAHDTVETIRDKLSAHIDKKVTSWDAARRLRDFLPPVLGAALHSSITTLLKFLDVDVYAWFAENTPEGFVRLMSSEPYLVTFRQEGENMTELVKLEVAKSPRYDVNQLCQEVIHLSQWLFDASGDSQIMTRYDV